MIPNVRHDRSTKMPDPIGSLMAILTIGAISFGLLNGHTWGWGNGRIIASWIVAVVCRGRIRDQYAPCARASN